MWRVFLALWSDEDLDRSTRDKTVILTLSVESVKSAQTRSADSSRGLSMISVFPVDDVAVAVEGESEVA